MSEQNKRAGLTLFALPMAAAVIVAAIAIAGARMPGALSDAPALSDIVKAAISAF